MWAVGLSVFNTVCAGNMFSGRGDVFLLLTNLYLRRLRNLAMEWRNELGPLIITSQVDCTKTNLTPLVHLDYAT